MQFIFVIQKILEHINKGGTISMIFLSECNSNGYEKCLVMKIAGIESAENIVGLANLAFSR